MSGFITALIKQRREAKKAEPDTNGRLREILGVLKKYDYDDGITPEIVTSILQDLGPTFVKIGQIASQQADYIPHEYCEALVKLRSKVAPMDMETVHAQIEKYLGKPVDELYASFDDKPLGSASIAQVHKATLHDGTVVAVKVRRPGIVDTVARDFALIEKILDKFVKKGQGGIDIKGFIVELENTSKNELDLTNEAANIERFYANNHGREKVECPKCYRELTCEAVLTEDFVIGKEVSDTAFLDTLSADERQRIAELVADNFASQILTDGFYHADPHSGNVLIKEPESGKRSKKAKEENPDGQERQLPEHGIEWIDFGMMGTLSSKQRQLIIDIVTAEVMHDAYSLKKTVLQVAQPQGEINHGAILQMCEDMCNEYTGTDFGDFDLGDLMNSVLNGLQAENFKVDPFLTNLARGIIAIEGTIKTLSPNVNILNFFIDKVNIGLDFKLDLENPEKMNPEIAMKLLQLFQGVTDSSVKTAESLDMLEKGQIKVRTDFCFEEKTLATVNRLVSYLIRVLIVIALLIGSSLLCTAPTITGSGDAVTIIFRMVGFVGYALSVFYAYLLYRDVKKGK
ncbi:MAG: AarF/ABC1/UbiB kinase family protein [Clostridia bacterium]|nr:AarF/ABC1/UbiB kinase family protein [Clostridia bacterium]